MALTNTPLTQSEKATTPKILVENVNKNNFLELFSNQLKIRPNHLALKMEVPPFMSLK